MSHVAEMLVAVTLDPAQGEDLALHALLPVSLLPLTRVPRTVLKVKS